MLGWEPASVNVPRLRLFVPTGDHDVTGLLGNANGVPGDDLAFRTGGQLAANPSRQLLHGDYADSWRITNETSLFTYGAGESTETYTDRGFPDNPLTLDDFDDATLADAAAVCEDAGVTVGAEFDSCVFDTVITGDSAFAAGAATVTQPLIAVGAQHVDADGDIAVDFEGEIPPNFAPLRSSHDAALSNVAGVFAGVDRYRFDIAEVPSHQSATISLDLIAVGEWTGDTGGDEVHLEVDDTDVWSATFATSDTHTQSHPDAGSAGGTGTERTGTLASGEPFTVFPVTVQVDHLDPHLGAAIRATGVSGVSNQGFAIDNIHVAFDLVPPDVFDVALPVLIDDGGPRLRRNYGTTIYPEIYGQVLASLGGGTIPAGAVKLDGIAYHGLYLAFGPPSVDGWLTRLAADEVALADDDLLDVDRRQVLLDGGRVDLTPLEFEVLHYLRERPDTPVSRHAMLTDIWGHDTVVGSNVVDVVVRGLRKKLGRHADMVETVRGVGYRFRTRADT